MNYITFSILKQIQTGKTIFSFSSWWSHRRAQSENMNKVELAWPAFKSMLSTEILISNSSLSFLDDNTFSYIPPYKLFFMKGWQALVGQRVKNKLSSANVVKSLECLLNTDLNRSQQGEQSVNLSVCAGSTNAMLRSLHPSHKKKLMQAFLFFQDVCYISDVS